MCSELINDWRKCVNYLGKIDKKEIHVFGRGINVSSNDCVIKFVSVI